MAVNEAGFNASVAAIPNPLTSLIGRDRELEKIVDLLSQSLVRLITITGPGGVGKTRLAIEAASRANHLFPDGVRFIALAALIEPEAVVPAIARALNVQEHGKLRLVDQIAAATLGQHLLLVVDNFEHLLDSAPELAALLSACPTMKMLVTSRSRLRLAGEWEYDLGPLALHQQLNGTPTVDGDRSAAVQLFAQRARAADFGFLLTEHNLPAVEEICWRLGGLPLAIELAAARVRFLPPNAMLAYLPNPLALLKGGGPDLPERQRTMTLATRWSYELLSHMQQRAFRALTVFASSFALDAATTILHWLYRTEASEAEAVIESLVDQSLVRVVAWDDPRPRLTMLEPFRDFVGEMPEFGNEIDAIRRVHARYFLEFVEEGRPYVGPERLGKVQAIEREIENIYAALGWLITLEETEQALRMANALVFSLWQPRGRIHEQQTWLRRVIALQGTGLESERASAFAGLSLAETRSGNFNAAFLDADEALTNARASQQSEKLAWALLAKGVPTWRTGNHTEAKTLLEGAHALAAGIGDRHLHGWIHHNLAVNAAMCGEDEEATSHFNDAQALFQELGDPWEIADLESNIAWYLEERGEIARSTELQRHALKEYWRLGDAWLTQFSLFTAGVEATELGMSTEAVQLFGAMEQLRRQTGTAVPFGYAEEYARGLDRAREAMSELEFAAARAAGTSMPMDLVLTKADAIYVAWGESGANRRTPASARLGLSPRESEVLRCLAAGKTNREIAGELFISVPTVKVHVRSLMGKLNLDSRTALAAFAIRNELD